MSVALIKILFQTDPPHRFPLNHFASFSNPVKYNIDNINVMAMLTDVSCTEQH